MGSRLTVALNLPRSDEFRGRWVALDECSYDPRTAEACRGDRGGLGRGSGLPLQPHAGQRRSALRHPLFCDEAPDGRPPVSTRAVAHACAPRVCH